MRISKLNIKSDSTQINNLAEVIKKVLLGVMLSLFIITDYSNSVADDSLSSWTYLEWTALRTDQFWLDISHEDRWYDDFDQYTYAETRIKINTKILPWIKIGIAESLIQHHSNENEDTSESRPAIELKLENNTEKIQLEYRQKFEIREISGDQHGTIWDSRNRFQLVCSYDYCGEIQPLLNYEIFYNLREGDWDQHRFFAGTKIKIMDQLSIAPLAGIQSVNHGHGWDNLPVVSLNLIIDLSVI